MFRTKWSSSNPSEPYSGRVFSALPKDGGKSKKSFPPLSNLSHMYFNYETWDSYNLPKEVPTNI